ncbi:hypothetical protein [Streptomyces sp. NPDC056921]|uniref:hypothetical protein n=1 Tax=Streptomyces sp. NPDC056921 TaxID=3345966 RepID=UPI0036382765
MGRGKGADFQERCLSTQFGQGDALVPGRSCLRDLSEGTGGTVGEIHALTPRGDEEHPLRGSEVHAEFVQPWIATRDPCVDERRTVTRSANLTEVQIVLGSALSKGGSEAPGGRNIRVQLGIRLAMLPGRARFSHADMITLLEPATKWGVRAGLKGQFDLLAGGQLASPLVDVKDPQVDSILRVLGVISSKPAG